MLTTKTKFGAIAIYLVLLGLFVDSIKSEDLLTCMRSKCEPDKLEDEIKNGEAVCSYMPNNQPAVGNKCGHECMGWKKAEDQAKCLCEACKAPSQDHRDYCKEPEGDNIGSKDNCDDTVCKGEAMYRGKFCKKA